MYSNKCALFSFMNVSRIQFYTKILVLYILQPAGCIQSIRIQVLESTIANNNQTLQDYKMLYVLEICSLYYTGTKIRQVLYL